MSKLIKLFSFYYEQWPFLKSHLEDVESDVAEWASDVKVQCDFGSSHVGNYLN